MFSRVVLLGAPCIALGTTAYCSQAEYDKVAIVGGGVAALALAHSLKSLSPDTDITLYEAQNRLGGWIETSHAPYMFECGPRSLRPVGSGLAVLDLIKELGIDDELILADRASKKRFLYSSRGGGGVQPLSMWSPVIRPHLPVIAREALRLPNGPGAGVDETLREFFIRRFSEDFADSVVAPFISGVYAGDISQLSFRATLGKHVGPAEDEWGSVLRGKVAEALSKWAGLAGNPERASEFASSVSGIFSFKRGLCTLVNALEESVRKKGVKIYLDSAVSSVSPTGDGVVITSGGSTQKFDFAFIATPAYHAAAVLAAGLPGAVKELPKDNAQALQSAVSFLGSISYSSVAVVHVVFPGSVIPKEMQGEMEIPSAAPHLTWIGPRLKYLHYSPRLTGIWMSSPLPAHLTSPLLSSGEVRSGEVSSGEGFGYLVPPKEKQPVLGVVFDSCTFPEHDQHNVTEVTRMTVMMGGAHRADLLEESEDVLASTAVSTIQQHLGISVSPVYTNVLKANKAIAQYAVGHMSGMEKLNTDLERLPIRVLGSSFRGVSVNDCVVDGLTHAAQFVRG